MTARTRGRWQPEEELAVIKEVQEKGSVVETCAGNAPSTLPCTIGGRHPMTHSELTVSSLCQFGAP